MKETGRFRFAVGMDVGASNTKIGLVDASARIMDHQTIASELQSDSPAVFLDAAGAVVRRYVDQYPVSGLGISLCSFVNPDHSGALLAVNAPALNGFDIRSAFAVRFGLPVLVCNDVNAYALAEYHHGAGQGVKRLICLALGTGLAVAAVLDGRVIETWGGVAADAARLILVPGSDIRCKAGVRGAAEALCGTPHIERLARALYQRDVPAREVIASARQAADPRALQVMAEIGGHVGHLLALLSPIFFPQRIVITGGSAEAGEALFAPLRQVYAELIGDYMLTLARLEHDSAAPRPVEIVKAGLGPDAAVIGAVWGFFTP